MKPGMILYREELGMLLMMTAEDAGEAVRLLARRFLRDIEPETDNERIADFLASALPKLDKDIAEYEKKVSAGQAGGKQSASKRQAQSKHTSSTGQAEVKQDASTGQRNKEQGTRNIELKNKEPVVVAFRPPTLDEVKEYCNERNSGISAEHFYDYYSSNGWQVGRTKMKDWKAAVRTWERTEFKRSEPKTTTTLSDGDFISHDWDYDKLQAIAEARGLQR